MTCSACAKKKHFGYKKVKKMGTVLEFYPKEGHTWVDGGDRYMFAKGVNSLAGTTRPHKAGELKAIKKFHKHWKTNVRYASRPENLSDDTPHFHLRPDNFLSGSDAQASEAFADDWARKPETQLLHRYPNYTGQRNLGIIRALNAAPSSPFAMSYGASVGSSSASSLYSAVDPSPLVSSAGGSTTENYVDGFSVGEEPPTPDSEAGVGAPAPSGAPEMMTVDGVTAPARHLLRGALRADPANERLENAVAEAEDQFPYHITQQFVSNIMRNVKGQFAPSVTPQKPRRSPRFDAFAARRTPPTESRAQRARNAPKRLVPLMEGQSHG